MIYLTLITIITDIHLDAEICVVASRPCDGTTVAIYQLFHQASVRQRRTSPSQALAETLSMVQKMAVLHPTVSFSLRNEATAKLLLNSSKHSTLPGQPITRAPD